MAVVQDRLTGMAALEHQAIRNPRTRHFPRLGWSVIEIPMDVMPYRLVAEFALSKVYGFAPDEMYCLRARRLGESPDRTWWLIAVETAALEHRRHEASAT